MPLSPGIPEVPFRHDRDVVERLVVEELVFDKAEAAVEHDLRFTPCMDRVGQAPKCSDFSREVADFRTLR